MATYEEKWEALDKYYSAKFLGIEHQIVNLNDDIAECKKCGVYVLMAGVKFLVIKGLCHGR